MNRKSCTFHTVFILCTCCLCPWTIQTNARWAFLRWFLSLLSALNIRFALSLEQKCWNGYSLMNCVCVCVSLTGGVWKMETVIGCWRGSWTVRRPSVRTQAISLPHTPSSDFDAQFISFFTQMSWGLIRHKLCLQYQKFQISVEINAECWACICFIL